MSPPPESLDCTCSFSHVSNSTGEDRLRSHAFLDTVELGPFPTTQSGGPTPDVTSEEGAGPTPVKAGDGRGHVEANFGRRLGICSQQARELDPGFTTHE